MKHNNLVILNTTTKQTTNLPCIPDTRNIQGGFKKCADFIKCFVTCRNNKRNVVDSLSCCGFSGRVEGLALSQPLTYFFYSRVWI
jgi:hypothetical protein